VHAHAERRDRLRGRAGGRPRARKVMLVVFDLDQALIVGEDSCDIARTLTLGADGTRAVPPAAELKAVARLLVNPRAVEALAALRAAATARGVELDVVFCTAKGKLALLLDRVTPAGPVGFVRVEDAAYTTRFAAGAPFAAPATGGAPGGPPKAGVEEGPDADWRYLTRQAPGALAHEFDRLSLLTFAASERLGLPAPAPVYIVGVPKDLRVLARDRGLPPSADAALLFDDKADTHAAAVTAFSGPAFGGGDDDARAHAAARMFRTPNFTLATMDPADAAALEARLEAVMPAAAGFPPHFVDGVCRDTRWHDNMHCLALAAEGGAEGAAEGGAGPYSAWGAPRPSGGAVTWRIVRPAQALTPPWPVDAAIALLRHA